MNVIEIISQAQIMFGDTEATVFAPSEYLAFLNMVQEDFAARTGCVVNTDQLAIDLTEGEPDELEWPNGAIRILRADFDGSPLRIIDHEDQAEIRRNYSGKPKAGTPSAILPEDQIALRIIPEPDTDLDGKTIDVWSSYLPDSIAEDTQPEFIPDIPPQYHYRLVAGMLALLYRAETNLRDSVKANEWSVIYEHGVAMAKQDTEEFRTAHRPKRVRVVGGYFF